MKSTRRSEPRRKHRLTRLGFHFLFVSSFAVLGGALRGFNLLLVLAGLLVGALIMQWRWSKRSVESVSVTRRLPTEAFAGKSFRIRYLLRNHSRWMPVWMMRVEDRIESVDKVDQAAAVCAAGVISPNQTVQPYCDCVVRRRGRYRFGPIQLMTTFPFSLFRSLEINDDFEPLHVFPELLTLRGDWRARLISRSGGMATTGQRSGPSEGDFFGLREWQTGDSPKWIHWRTTARIGEPIVRQFEQQRRFDVCILVDAFQDAPTTAGSTGWLSKDPRSKEHDPLDPDPSADVEMAISLAATIMVHLINSPSNRVVLAIAADESEAIIGSGSVVGKRRMLELLADVVPSALPSVHEAARRTLRIVGNTQDLIVISPRSMAEAKRSDPKLAEAIAPWTRRGSFRWLDVSNRELDRWVARDANYSKVADEDRTETGTGKPGFGRAPSTPSKSGSEVSA
ncbi:hypothetical protein K227x_26690 [Rubripirellula lacrimiformis]|uniref:DUF58 domain-containing protein n=1 Tax=Rubripirellula lacrimiformis TaxID=1930273 RepID=A0A517NAW6_9BACT|nr:DUF58 domain-containing protein [Rubripirellula lacrimiformis]QDT04279.1 hypothetical protein K227x_26690 [Rubripirellula lacrimiformis]